MTDIDHLDAGVVEPINEHVRVFAAAHFQTVETNARAWRVDAVGHDSVDGGSALNSQFPDGHTCWRHEAHDGAWSVATPPEHGVVAIADQLQIAGRHTQRFGDVE